MFFRDDRFGYADFLLGQRGRREGRVCLKWKMRLGRERDLFLFFVRYQILVP